MLISKFGNSNNTEILLIEKNNGIGLSSQYKDFLYRYNGGYTPKTKFKVGKISSDIKGFYGSGKVKLSLNDIDLDDWIEKGIFPIASDSFGNTITIGIDEKKFGKIYFCNHETGNRLYLVGKDLKEFVSICKSDIISVASRRTIKEREEALIANGRGDIITDSLRQMWQNEIDKYSNMFQEEVIID